MCKCIADKNVLFQAASIRLQNTIKNSNDFRAFSIFEGLLKNKEIVLKSFKYRRPQSQIKIFRFV